MLNWMIAVGLGIVILWGRKINCVMLYFSFKLIGRGSASAKGRDHPSRRA